MGFGIRDSGFGRAGRGKTCRTNAFASAFTSPESQVPNPGFTPNPVSQIPNPGVTPNPESQVPNPGFTPNPESRIPNPGAPRGRP
jgi:hypothetical protein